MTTLEMSGKIGKTAVYQWMDMFAVDVKIEDARFVYGKVQYKIRPINGTGWKWVDEGSIKIKEIE